MFMLWQELSKKVWRWLKEKKQFANTNKICTFDKFILMLRKGVYLYDYMDDLEKFNKTSLPKKDFLHQRKHGRYYWCRL